MESDDRPKPPPELLERIREIGRVCVLAGCDLQETLAALNAEARKYGLEYRPRMKA